MEKKIAKADKKDSAATFEDPHAQALISKFLNGEITVLEPTYDAKTGYHFPTAEAIAGDSNKAEAFLNKLAQEKILVQKLFDKVIYCPKCGSAKISFRYCCPFCKSFYIQKSSLIEHVKCGYMDLEENFRKEAKLVCPKCHEGLKQVEVDFRKAGVWCACKDCGKSFDIPVPQHYCTSCQGVSNFEEATIKDIYSYTLSEAAKQKMSSNMFLTAPIREFLQHEGLKVESPAYVLGKSGAKHSFSIVAYKEKTQSKPIVIDIALSSEGLVSEQPVIALFAKTFDVSSQKAFLIAIPGLGENAKKMAELYGITAINAKTQEEAVAALKSKLEN